MEPWLKTTEGVNVVTRYQLWKWKLFSLKPSNYSNMTIWFDPNSLDHFVRCDSEQNEIWVGDEYAAISIDCSPNPSL